MNKMVATKRETQADRLFLGKWQFVNKHGQPMRKEFEVLIVRTHGIRPADKVYNGWASVKNGEKNEVIALPLLHESINQGLLRRI